MNDVHVPRNPQEAINQANRLQRAELLLTQGYTFTYDAELETVFVTKPGELHAAYTIGAQVDGTDGCSCPDKAKGNVCKHEIAWSLIQKQEAEELAGLEAQCKQWEAENEELPEYDATRILMLSELRRAERSAKNTVGTSAAEGWQERVRKCEAALKMYDEIKVKQAINFYKRIPA